MHGSPFWRLALQDEGGSMPGFWGGLSSGVLTVYFLLCPHMAEGTGEPSGGPFLRALVPLTRLHAQDRITSQIPHLLIPSHGGLGFQHTSFGTHKHSVCNTLPPPPTPSCYVALFSPEHLWLPSNTHVQSRSWAPGTVLGLLVSVHCCLSPQMGPSPWNSTQP